MTEKKITKKDNFNAIIEVLTEVGREDLAKVVEHEIELLDAKSSKAKATAAKKKAEGDALRDAVQAVLTDELCTIADITAKVEFEGFDGSQAKVQYRLNALVNAEIARKEQITVGEGDSKRKLMAYAIASDVVVED